MASSPRAVKNWSRYALTVGAVVVAAALAAYVGFVRPPEPGTALATLDPANVQVITLTRGEQQLVVARDAKGDWRLQEPLDWPADTTRATDLVQAAAGLRASRKLQDHPADLAPYGLEPPRLRVRLQTASAQTELLIGDPTATGDGYYVQRAGDPALYVADMGAITPIDVDANTLRSHQVTQFFSQDVRRITLTRGALRVELDHVGTRWQIASPFSDWADPSQMDELILSLGSLQAVGFADDHPTDLAAYGLDRPRAVITVDFQKRGNQPAPAPLTLRVGKAKDENTFYLQTSSQPTVFIINDPQYKPLQIQPDELLDHTLLTPYSAEVAAVTLQVAPDKVPIGTLTHRSDGWHLGEKAIADDAVEMLLQALRDMKIDKRLTGDGVRQALAHPAWELSVQPNDSAYAADHHARTLRVAPYAGGYAVSVSDRPGTYAISPKAFDALKAAWLGLSSST